MDNNARRWLKWLLIVQIISLTHAALTKVVNYGVWYQWLDLAVRAGVPFCMFKLRREHKFYAVAAVFLCIEFICVAFTTLINSGAVFPLVRDLAGDNLMQFLWYVSVVKYVLLVICGLGAMLFEHMGHHSLMKDISQKLSKYWLWMMLGSLALSLAITGFAILASHASLVHTLNIVHYRQIYPFLDLPGILLKIAYTVLLFQTERMLRYAQPNCEEIL